MLAEPFIVLQTFNLDLLDLSDLAKVFAKYTKNGDLLLLSGRVGAGKTEFSRLLIKARATIENVGIEEVSSPTFSLIQSYDFQECRISHIDLYRVNSEVEIFELGIPDVFDSQITLLEWPEILETKDLTRYISIKIEETKKLSEFRCVKVAFFGNGWDALIGALLGSGHFDNKNI